MLVAKGPQFVVANVCANCMITPKIPDTIMQITKSLSSDYPVKTWQRLMKSALYKLIARQIGRPIIANKKLRSKALI